MVSGWKLGINASFKVFLSDRPSLQLRPFSPPFPPSNSADVCLWPSGKPESQPLHACILVRNETDVCVWGGEPAAVPSHLPRGARKLGTSCETGMPKAPRKLPSANKQQGQGGRFQVPGSPPRQPPSRLILSTGKIVFSPTPRRRQARQFRLNVTWRAPARGQNTPKTPNSPLLQHEGARQLRATVWVGFARSPGFRVSEALARSWHPDWQSHGAFSEQNRVEAP